MRCPLCNSDKVLVKSEIRSVYGANYLYKWKRCSECNEEYEDEELIDENLSRVSKLLGMED